MKKTVNIVLAAVLLCGFFSCESVPRPEKSAAQAKAEPPKTTPAAVAETEAEPPAAEEDVPAETVPKENIEFIERMRTTKMSVVSSPATTTKNRAFGAAYVVSVTQDGNPAAGVPVTVSYPSSRENDEYHYTDETVSTDSSGRISFTPPVPSHSADTYVTFYPTPVNDDEDVVLAAKENAVSARWRVRTDYISRQGMIYVFDYDARGRAGNNSFSMLRALRNSGFNIGNSPIGDASYLSRPTDDLYRATKAIAGNAFGMLISGSVKYAEPIKALDGKYTCTLVADISCINMSDGSVLYRTERRQTAVGRDEQDALALCRENISADVTQALMYGM